MKTILRPSGESSFLKDAARDLVVVVVGILAALWLESWWQERLDRNEEQQILAGLIGRMINEGKEILITTQDIVQKIDAEPGAR